MRIVAVIAAFVLLLFTVVLEVVFITGGVRMHRRFGNHLKGVWLQLCAAAFVILFVGFAVLLYRYRGAFWLLEPPGALLVVYLYGIFIFFFGKTGLNACTAGGDVYTFNYGFRKGTWYINGWKYEPV